MKSFRSITLSACTGLIMVMSTHLAYSAHESNNRAILTDGNGDSRSGIALVNYAKGKDTWTASTTVFGLADGIYTFAVRVNTGDTIGEPQIICMLVPNPAGVASCSSSQFALDGFHEALIFDLDGNIVLSGFFERRGGSRVSQ